jgi:deferrochelatase/peroxidase EfeB
MRQLQQDVHGFWQHLDRQAGGDAAHRTRLAEAMVGRTLKGRPLVELDNPGDPNAFSYQGDPDGVRCPLGAHIRRSNPRNADLPPGRTGRTGHGGIVSWLTRTLGFDAEALDHDRVASTRFHRLLRRGREYGPAVALPAALTGHGDGVEVGLHFMCLGANIARQFEFVQGAWLAGLHFDGLRNESDPLLGSRTPAVDGTATDAFSMPQADGPDQRLSGLPPFVTVRGGAYFFLPGLRALRWLATAS